MLGGSKTLGKKLHNGDVFLCTLVVLFGGRPFTLGVRQDKQDKSNVIIHPDFFHLARCCEIVTFKKKVSVFVGTEICTRKPTGRSQIGMQRRSVLPFSNHWLQFMGIFAKVTRCE